ncbi:MAG: ATP-grasp domain-containing protein, partial [Gemmatimonadaceae bacterium]
EYPLDWQAVVDYVGLPCVVKDAHGGGWKHVHVCHSVQELINAYDQSGLLTMIVQEFIKFDHFVRCICLGQEDILPIKYDPAERKYIVDHAHLSQDMGTRIVEQSRTICRALGYDMNSIEWALRDGVPYAIDFMNCAPDMDINSLTPTYFEWAVKHLADTAIRLVHEPRKQSGEFGWARVFTASRLAPRRTTGPGPAVSPAR